MSADRYTHTHTHQLMSYELVYTSIHSSIIYLPALCPCCDIAMAYESQYDVTRASSDVGAGVDDVVVSSSSSSRPGDDDARMCLIEKLTGARLVAPNDVSIATAAEALVCDGGRRWMTGLVAEALVVRRQNTMDDGPRC